VILINDMLIWFTHRLSHMSQRTEHNKIHHMTNDDIEPTLDRYLQIWFRDEAIFMWLLLIILIFYKNKYKLYVALSYFVVITFLHFLFHTKYKLGSLYERLK
jgi:sterol desaturase/sphingolipid hydroxylase (fatty acid hydroxylase superfamily)